MQTKPPLVLRIFQWTLWLLMLALVAYAFLPGILFRLTGGHDAPVATPPATEQVSQ